MFLRYNVNIRLMHFLNYIKYFRDQHRGLLLYYIPIEDVNWSRIFLLMERKRTKLNIEDYTVTQIPLDEIIMELTQYQREMFVRRLSIKWIKLYYVYVSFDCGRTFCLIYFNYWIFVLTILISFRSAKNSHYNRYKIHWTK